MLSVRFDLSNVSRRLLTLTSVIAVLAIPGSALGFVVIGNGGAPPDAANVINDATYAGESVYVRNVGCPPDWPVGSPQAICLAPGVSTAVQIGPNADIGGHLTSLDTSSVEMVGGSIGGTVSARDESTVTILGGSITDDLKSLFSSTVRVEGGTIGNGLFAYANSQIQVVGSNFAVNGVPVRYGPLQAESGQLTGILDQGDAIDNTFNQGGFIYTGDIILTDPEAGVTDVKANGFDDIIDVLPGDDVTFSIGFTANGYAGGPGEFYLAVVVPGAVIWVTEGGLTPVPAPFLTLPAIADIPQLDLLTLPAEPGFFAIVFIADEIPNGMIDQGFWVDFAGYLAPAP